MKANYSMSLNQSYVGLLLRRGWASTLLQPNDNKEIKKRYKLTAQELADVADAIKEVGNQLGDIDDAVAGGKRRGRPKKNG